ncbi:hypothetical protein BDU57DRAFT_121428 [Ampelomyces quisqualis]|uniref:Uncharacterized protein n=1 Tax=Ampelomyces quisqualis TaxID=50730 RepID=A0A6A5QSS3_AMPQU|nr:hypothetical protein BDU57DRAFT_121428 [Ampelomyces quisqualis]
MLGKPPTASDVTSNRVQTAFDAKLAQRDVEANQATAHNIKRLIEVHWLHGFPLWASLTSLSDQAQILFTDYMYSVRQVVALWRLDETLWRRLTVRSLRVYDLVKCRVSQEMFWANKSTPELVEAAISMLAEASEFKLGYRGSWSPEARGGSDWHEKHMRMFWYRGGGKEGCV